MIYRFCFRTAFTKEARYYKADNVEDAKRQYHEETNKRLPIRCYLDYIWECDKDTNPINRIL